MTNFIQLNAFYENSASRQRRSTDLNLLVLSQGDGLVGLWNLPMTVGDLLFTVMDEGREADAGAEKTTVTPDPTCGKALDRFSTIL